MSMKLNRPPYRRLLEEDIDWLQKQERTLEREHIEQVLRYELEHLVIYEHDTRPDNC